MPDPVQHASALLTAFSCSAVFSLVLYLTIRATDSSIARILFIPAMGIGFVAGWKVLQFSSPWPPGNALDRFLVIVMPVVILLESIAAAGTVSSRFRWLLAIVRCGLFLSAGRILWHGSVYLRSDSTEMAELADMMLHWGPLPVLVFCGAILCAASMSLSRLCEQPLAGTVVWSIILSILVAGVSTMLAGYIKGGISAVLMSGCLAGAGTVMAVVRQKQTALCEIQKGLATISVLCLFGQLWIARWFGQVTTGDAVLIFLTPQFCWITEAPVLRNGSDRLRASIRLLTVCGVLGWIVFRYWQSFTARLAPLIAVCGQQNFP